MFQQNEINFLQIFIKDYCGVILETDNPTFFEARLNNVLHQHNITSLFELCYKIKDNKMLLDEVISQLTTHESLFFRDDSFFSSLDKIILPHFHEINKEKKTLYLWSAACSNGQEPYSVKMLIDQHHLNFSNWDVKIYCSDISKQCIEYAKKGEYSHFEIQRGVQKTYLDKYFTKHNDNWKIQSSMQQNMEFFVHNLIQDQFPYYAKLDIILLRNVLIYFDLEMKKKVLQNMQLCLNPKGALILGGPETIIGISQQYILWPMVNSSIYQLI